MKPMHVDDCRLYPLCRCHGRCRLDHRGKPAPGDGPVGVTLLVLAAAVLAGAWLFLAVSDASAHDALPTAMQLEGWSYPFSCCSGYDCREVPEKAISERPEGYVIKRTGEVIAYSDHRIKNSPDGEFSLVLGGRRE